MSWFEECTLGFASATNVLAMRPNFESWSRRVIDICGVYKLSVIDFVVDGNEYFVAFKDKFMIT